MFNRLNLKKLDPALVTVVIILSIIGAATVFSTTYFPDKTASSSFFNQILFYIIGFIIFIILSAIDYKKLQHPAFAIGVFIFTIATLVAVLIFGNYAYEAKRWIVIGNFTIQPSEFAKLTIILITSYSLSFNVKKEFEKIISIYKPKKQSFQDKTLKVFRNQQVLKLIFSVLAVGSTIFFVMLQKSLGNSVIIFLTFLLIVFFSVELNRKFFVYLIVIALGLNVSFSLVNFNFIYQRFNYQPPVDFLMIIVCLIIIIVLNRIANIRLPFALILFTIFLFSNLILGFGYNNILQPYQRNRIETFLKPDPNESLSDNYNREQAILAIGSGGFLGRGFLNGTVTNLGLLPFAFTDFAYASYAEQFGFLGSIFLFALYFILLFKIISIAKNVKDKFGMLIVGGVAVMIALNCLQHIGMNLGIFPITGVPLPLISYGGSSVLTVFIGLGLVQAIEIRSEDEEVELVDLRRDMNI